MDLRAIECCHDSAISAIERRSSGCSVSELCRLDRVPSDRGFAAIRALREASESKLLLSGRSAVGFHQGGGSLENCQVIKDTV